MAKFIDGIEVKPTEVKLFINGSDQPIVMLVTVIKSKMACVQSKGTKAKQTIELASFKKKKALEKNDLEEANRLQAVMDKTVTDLSKEYKDLVKDKLTAALPGMHLKYTENNTLLTMKYDDQNTEQIWFETNKECEDETEVMLLPNS